MVDRRSRRRVVVTGIGALTPVGNDAHETWKNLVAGVSGGGPITAFDPSPYLSRIACLIKGFVAADHLPPKEAPRMARCSQLAIVAARQAVADASLDWSVEDRERAGVTIGTGVGGIDMMHEPIMRMVSTGVARTTPHNALAVLPNMPGFHVGQDQGCLGPLSTAVTACAAGTQAVGDAVEIIRRGAADVMLAGGTESQITPMFLGGFTALRVVSGRNDDPEHASRPFDRDRDGFVMGEAAAFLVLEEAGHAVRRGARIYAEMLGFGLSQDAFHIAQPDMQGAGPVRAMRWALADAGLAPEEIDYINAHGTATVLNDQVETTAIKRVFGDYAYRIPISSAKSMTGHCLGGSGAIEAIASVMTVCTDTIHPTINLENPDPACDLDYVPGTARKQRVDTVLSNSFGFGGQNACLVVSEWRQ